MTKIKSFFLIEIVQNKNFLYLIMQLYLNRVVVFNKFDVQY